MFSATSPFLFEILLLAFLFVGFFRVDETMAQPVRERFSKRFRPGTDRAGRAMSDPDGRPWTTGTAGTETVN